LNTSCEAHKTLLCRVLRTSCLYWIPAFAGMTALKSMAHKN
jgi:hypothetical protein